MKKSQFKRLVRINAAKVFSAVLTFLMRILPPDEEKILVFGKPDFEENSLLVALRAQQIVGEQNVILMCRSISETRRYLANVATATGSAYPGKMRLVKRNPFTATWFMITCGLVMFSTPIYVSPRVVGKRIHVNLWHGTGPKWSSNSNYQFRIGAQALCSCAGAWFESTVEGLGMGPRTKELVGNPRQDLLHVRDERKRAIRRWLKVDEKKPVVIYAPTYRETKKLGVGVLRDSERLSDSRHENAVTLTTIGELAVNAGVVLIAKPHPEDADDFRSAGIRVVSSEEIYAAGFTTYEFFGIADAMVSDYSSVWVDYLELSRPVALYCPDLRTYVERRGLNSPGLDQIASGLFVESETELCDFFDAIASGTAWRTSERELMESGLGFKRNASKCDALFEELDLSRPVAERVIR